MKNNSTIFITFISILPTLMQSSDVQKKWLEKYEISQSYIHEHYNKYKKTIYSVLDAAITDDILRMQKTIDAFPEKGKLALLNEPFMLSDIKHYATSPDHATLRAYIHDNDEKLIFYDMLPLCFALILKNKNSVELFLDNGAYADFPKREGHPMAIAVKYTPELIPLLLEHGALLEGNPYQDAPLVTAAIEGNLAAAKQLVEKGAQIEVRAKTFSLTPLCIAGNHGRYDLVKYLISRGAQVNATNDAGSPPLFWATGNVKSHIVNLLLENGANIRAINNAGETVIEWIGYDFQSTDAFELIRQGAPYPKTEFHQKLINKALRFSLTFNHPFYQKYLYALLPGKTDEAIAAIHEAQGNELNESTFTMRELTVLHWAVIRGNFEVVNTLLNLHKKEGRITKQVRSALTQLPLVTSYVVHPVNINCLDEHMHTPLMWAARLGYKEIYDLLKQHGANQLLKDKDGLTAEAYIFKYKNTKLIDTLSNAND